MNSTIPPWPDQKAGNLSQEEAPTGTSPASETVERPRAAADSGTVRPPVLPPPPLRGSIPQAPAPTPPRSGGSGWKALALILLLLLLLVTAVEVGGWVMGWMGAGGGVAGGDASSLQEIVIDDRGGEAKLAVLDIEGIIVGGLLGGGSGGLVELVREQLRRAEKDDLVKAVLLRIDSPGGEVLAADDIYRKIEEFQQRSGKPVIASMGSVAASGGYYVAAPCRWIVANPLTITGSIGVIMHGYNYRELMNKVGVRPEVYKSGRFKDMLSGDKADGEILPEERKMVQALVDETFLRFKQVVAEGRQRTSRVSEDAGRKLVKNWDEYVDGRVFSGRQAHEWGFVDELGDFQAAVKRAEELVGVDRAKLIRYDRPFELGSFLRLFASQARGVTLDLGIEKPPLQAGRLYYLFLPGIR